MNQPFFGIKIMNSIFSKDLFKDDTVLITGGGSGIGAGIALEFAKHGANVAILGRTKEKLEKTALNIEKQTNKPVLCLKADVRNEEDVKSCVNNCVEQFGKLTVVINGAAGNFPIPAVTLSSNGFKSVLDIDLLGTFHVSKASFHHLSKQGGVIINITAIQAIIPTVFQVHVGAAKAGIEKMTKDLALEWASFGIRVNSISPGPVANTEGARRLSFDGSENSEEAVSNLPLKRYASIFEIAQATLFLASPAAAYMTGSSLLIDGGTNLVGGSWFKLPEMM